MFAILIFGSMAPNFPRLAKQSSDLIANQRFWSEEADVDEGGRASPAELGLAGDYKTERSQ
jgi:hypothetical protein